MFWVTKQLLAIKLPIKGRRNTCNNSNNNYNNNTVLIVISRKRKKQTDNNNEKKRERKTKRKEKNRTTSKHFIIFDLCACAQLCVRVCVRACGRLWACDRHTSTDRQTTRRTVAAKNAHINVHGHMITWYDTMWDMSMKHILSMHKQELWACVCACVYMCLHNQ